MVHMVGVCQESGGKRCSYSPRPSDGQETTFLGTLLHYNTLQCVVHCTLHCSALVTLPWELNAGNIRTYFAPPSRSKLVTLRINNIFTPIFPRILSQQLFVSEANQPFVKEFKTVNI